MLEAMVHGEALFHFWKAAEPPLRRIFTLNIGEFQFVVYFKVILQFHAIYTEHLCDLSCATASFHATPLSLLIL